MESVCVGAFYYAVFVARKRFLLTRTGIRKKRESRGYNLFTWVNFNGMPKWNYYVYQEEATTLPELMYRIINSFQCICTK